MAELRSLRGVVLKLTPVGEADEIVTLYTEGAGKVRAYARAVRLPQSKLRHGLQPLFESQVELAFGRLPVVTGVRTHQTFGRLRETPGALSAAYHALELLLKGTPDDQPAPDLYRTFAGLLRTLDAAPPVLQTAAELVRFQLALLGELGVPPPLAPAAPGRDLFFSPARGGFSTERGASGEPASRAAYDLLAAMGSGSGLPKEPTAAPELSRLLGIYTSYHLERELKTAPGGIMV